MSTQGRTSDQPEQTSPSDTTTATPATGEGTNLLHRWVRLVQQSTLWGNEAGQVRLDELAQGPTTPRIQTLEEIRTARAAAVAEEEAASAGATSWWDDAICADEEVEARADEGVCESADRAGELAECPLEDGGDALEPQLAEMPPIFTLPPVVTPPTTAPPVPPALPVAAGEGLLARVLAFGARRVLPILTALVPKPTAPPELDEVPYAGTEGGWEPVTDFPPVDDNKCRAEEVKHRGGDKIHDSCADALPGNQIPGRDLLVITPEGSDKNFDAYTPADNSVWEVKTHKLDDKSARSFKFLAGKEIAGLKAEQEIANRCGYNFKISVSDLRQYELLRDLFDVVYRPECLSQEPAAPAEQGP